MALSMVSFDTKLDAVKTTADLQKIHVEASCDQYLNLSGGKVGLKDFQSCSGTAILVTSWFTGKFTYITEKYA